MLLVALTITKLVPLTVWPGRRPSSRMLPIENVSPPFTCHPITPSVTVHDNSMDPSLGWCMTSDGPAIIAAPVENKACYVHPFTYYISMYIMYVHK